MPQSVIITVPLPLRMLEIFHKPVHPLETVSYSTVEVSVLEMLWHSRNYQFTTKNPLPIVLICIPPETKPSMTKCKQLI